MNSNLSAIRQYGLKVLTKELGATGTILFLRQFETGYGNYTNERDNLHKDLTLEDIVASIQARKTETNCSL